MFDINIVIQINTQNITKEHQHDILQLKFLSATRSIYPVILFFFFSGLLVPFYWNIKDIPLLLMKCQMCNNILFPLGIYGPLWEPFSAFLKQ